MVEWITGFIASAGYAGIAALMLLENVFPPVPSELIMPLAGFNAARGELSLVGAVLAGFVGSLAGAYVWYEVARRFGTERLKRWATRHGRWLTLDPKEIARADAWFDRHGHKAVLLGRLVPGIRTLISVPAGLSEMKPARFLLYSGVGTLLWTTVLTLAGYLLESRYREVEGWVNPISTVVLVGLVALYLYRVVTFRPSGATSAGR
jgi:membrane protein DedA with SNARE-associated domain